MSIRVSFWLVGASRMPLRCAVTLPLFWEVTSPSSVSSFVVVDAAVWRTGLKRKIHVLAQGSQRFRWKKYPDRLVWAHPQNKMWHYPLLCALSPSLQFIEGVEIGDGIDDSGACRLYSLSARTTATAANTLNGLGGRLRSLRLGGTIGC